MMNVVGGGDALSQPAGFGVDRTWPEELGVVVELPDQLGVAVAEAALRQLDQ